MHTTILSFFLLAGGLTFLCGFMVRYRRMLGLLIVYDAKATKDKKGLARWAGNNLMAMAFLQFVCGLVGILTVQLVWAAVAFIASSLIITIILALGTADFSKTRV